MDITEIMKLMQKSGDNSNPILSILPQLLSNNNTTTVHTPMSSLLKKEAIINDESVNFTIHKLNENE